MTVHHITVIVIVLLFFHSSYGILYKRLEIGLLAVTLKQLKGWDTWKKLQCERMRFDLRLKAPFSGHFYVMK